MSEEMQLIAFGVLFVSVLSLAFLCYTLGNEISELRFEIRLLKDRQDFSEHQRRMDFIFNSWRE